MPADLSSLLAHQKGAREVNATKARPRQIKGRRIDKVTLGGWLQGRDTYLWIGDEDGHRCLATIGRGENLYRLAKAIVAQFESPDA